MIEFINEFDFYDFRLKLTEINLWNSKNVSYFHCVKKVRVIVIVVSLKFRKKIKEEERK